MVYSHSKMSASKLIARCSPVIVSTKIYHTQDGALILIFTLLPLFDLDRHSSSHLS